MRSPTSYRPLTPAVLSDHDTHWLAVTTPADDPLLDDARARVASYEEEVHHRSASRKANGVFYTPLPLARALAQLALGPALRRAIEAGDPGAIEALTVIDPASGAGSLLLAALELLERAHACACASKYDPIAPAARRRLLSGCLYAIDIDPGALRATADAISAACDGGETALHHVCADALLDHLPVAWPGSFDALLANPPFGTVNRLGRHHPRQQAIAARYPLVWQDKADISAFFVNYGAHLASRSAFIVPATLLAADKAQRLRTHLATEFDVRLLTLREVFLFPDADVTVALLDVADPHSNPNSETRDTTHPPPVRGWAFDSSDLDAAWTVLDAFARGLRPPAGVVIDNAITASRWNPTRPATSARWARMDAHAAPLGARYLVGKGMETGRNSAFSLSKETLDRLDDESRALFIRRRIRGVDVETLALRPATRWLLYPEDAESLDAIPTLLRDHLLAHRPDLERRAAYQRGNCAWWRYTWPLHRKHYHQHRVVTPYRSATHRFAAVAPADGVGLTDTTTIFVGSAAEALALAALLESTPLVDRYRGITKRTGAHMMEFFENQLREAPLPATWDRLVDPLARLAARVQHGEREARREIDALVADAFGLQQAPRQNTLWDT